MNMNSTALTVEVSVADSLSAMLESGDDDVPLSSMLQHWAQAAYLKQVPAVVSLYITTAEEIQQLNRDYRDRDKATNVLSFPMEVSELMPPEDGEAGPALLGDIALCSEVIRQEAHEQSKQLHAHWAHMVVHGMLHLQDYDHISDSDAEQMEKLEVQILESLGMGNPYAMAQ